MATFIVTNTNESGDDSLQNVVTPANGQAGVDIRAFEIQSSSSTDVIELRLVDAASDTVISTVSEGDVFQIDELPALSTLTLAASIPDSSPLFDRVESAFINFNNGTASRTENSEPYTLFGDIGGNFFEGGGLSLGDNSLSFELYSEDRLQGELLDTVVLNFLIAENTSPPTNLVVNTLVDELDGSVTDGDISLRDAIAAIAEGGTIIFDEELAGQTIVLDGEELAIDKSLQIDGDLNDDSNPDITIDANRRSRVFNIDDGIDNNHSQISLSGLTITRGMESASSGVLNRESLRITNSTITQNESDYDSSGISNHEGSLYLLNTSVVDNFGYFRGGIFNDKGVMSIVNSRVSENSSLGTAAIDNNGGTLNLINSEIINNYGADNNGVLRNSSDGNLTITNSSVSGNSSVDGPGGIENYGNLIVINSSVSNNTSFNSAGGISNINNGNLKVINSSITKNISEDYGGGIFNIGGNTYITDSEISQNMAGSGDAIANEGVLTIRNSTIANNSSGTRSFNNFAIANYNKTNIINSTITGNDAGIISSGELSIVGSTIVSNGERGIFVENDRDSIVVLESTIVAGHTGSSRTPALSISRVFPFIAPEASIAARNSLIESGAVTDDLGNNIFGQDPLLDPAGLQDNGGSTQTIALLATSPAINAGSNPENLDFDQRGTGFEREVGGQADIGAFEVQSPASTIDLAVGLFDADTDTFIASLQEGGTTLLASEIQDRNLSIAASVPDSSPFSGQVESAFLNFNQGQVTRTENSAPYSLFGDIGGNFAGGAIPLGQNTISFDLFSENRRRGELLGTVERTFTIADDLTGLDIGVFDADTNELIATLIDGTEIDASQLAGRSVNIAAFVPSDSPFAGQVESMFIDLNDGAVTRTENSEPYALFGDVDGSLFGGTLANGDNTIEFELYSENRRRGDLIDTIAINFSIT